MHECFRDLLFGTLRIAFRLVPMSNGTRDRLRQRFLSRFSGLVPPGPRGQLAQAAVLQRGHARADAPAIGHAPHRHESVPHPLPATLVAFYLPQFHPIPENDAWWGKGFTEWRNVARAQPQFEGHAQPRLPADLGFYDLRQPEVMREQAALAREYGIGAFCFYYYWFAGKTLLEQPVAQWREDSSIDLPYCLCWANENWSRRWDGREDEILIGQRHSDEDDIAFISHIHRYLQDPRYLRVDGRPLLLVYRPELLPAPKATAARWRTWCREHGVGEICLAYVQSFERPDPAAIGFDVAIEFPPNLSSPPHITGAQTLLNTEYRGQVLDWRELARDYCGRPAPGPRLFPGVNCGWDNEPRRPGGGRSYLHASPRRYRDWLHHTIHFRLRHTPPSDRYVFINAWNEWAEGAVLEPDARLGFAWLDATRAALSPDALAPAPTRPCVVIHAWYPEVFQVLLGKLLASGLQCRLIVTTSPERADAINAVLSASGMKAEVFVFENRGRDILPFLRIANRLLDEGEAVVLKLHTKRSPHLQNGSQWHEELVDTLLSTCADAFTAFVRDEALGLAAPSDHLLPAAQFVGANASILDRLAVRIGLPAEVSWRDTSFGSGSMFWVRLEALRPLLDAHLDDWNFEPEEQQTDGTLAHAIERIFGAVVRSAGYHVAGLAAEESRTSRADYPYARQQR